MTVVASPAASLTLVGSPWHHRAAMSSLASSPAASDAALGPCRICGADLGPAVTQPRSSYAAAGRFQIAACTGCGTGTTVPWPSDDELAACYAGSYGYGAHELIAAEKRYRSRRLVERAALTTGRVLDVGCMFGFLLDEAAATGLETWGVELASEPAAAARARGHRVTTGTLDDHRAAHPDVRFDAIFAQHVVEHLPDPRAFFAAAAALLVPGGRLVIAVPNFAARLRRVAGRSWGWYQVPVHLHHLTAAGLRHLAHDAGLAVDAEATRGGDTLFLALTATQGLGRTVRGDDGARASGPGPRLALGLAGRLLRPYYRLGDDELILVARRPR